MYFRSIDKVMIENCAAKIISKECQLKNSFKFFRIYKVSKKRTATFELRNIICKEFEFQLFDYLEKLKNFFFTNGTFCEIVILYHTAPKSK